MLERSGTDWRIICEMANEKWKKMKKKKKQSKSAVMNHCNVEVITRLCFFFFSFLLYITFFFTRKKNNNNKKRVSPNETFEDAPAIPAPTPSDVDSPSWSVLLASDRFRKFYSLVKSDSYPYFF